ncbi:diacylglycerol/lipid kinase family protein [Aquimonas voraii]|uniref:Diacylglycerol kinase family enzyme n=1 Tax=Aquimonas voraii TaxID=265719 RepID=A0A1G7A6R4_9GAMM|nr:diacylglycerol kinase family protein [Aquimonas voraii]SDE10618.1 Diacylglycerol kinase family enzyme [Aquimonas voraii]
MQPLPHFDVVMNTGSGRTEAQARRACVERVLREGGRAVQVRLVRHPRELSAQITGAIASARESGGAVVAAGGDGTINAVVQQVLGTGLPFGALPQGTFNFFGRSQGLSEHIETAARDLLDAELRDVPVGLVNERVFLINASIGLYRRLLQDREAFKRRLGRSRLVALWAGLNTLLRPHPRLELHLRDAEGERREQVLSFGAGINRLQLEQLGLPEAEAVERGQLLGFTLRPQDRLALLRVALRGLTGQWQNDARAHAFVFEQLLVQPTRGRRSVRVACDGEVARMRPPLCFRVSETRLPLLVPARRAEAGA